MSSIHQDFQKCSQKQRNLCPREVCQIETNHRANTEEPAAIVSKLKDDCALFSRLCTAWQSRERNLGRFFKHENQPWLPSLLNEMRSENKVDLLDELQARG